MLTFIRSCAPFDRISLSYKVLSYIIGTRVSATQAPGGPRGPNSLHVRYPVENRSQLQLAFRAARRELIRHGEGPQQWVRPLVLFQDVVLRFRALLSASNNVKQM